MTDTTITLPDIADVAMSQEIWAIPNDDTSADFYGDHEETFVRVIEDDGTFRVLHLTAPNRVILGEARFSNLPAEVIATTIAAILDHEQEES